MKTGDRLKPQRRWTPTGKRRRAALAGLIFVAFSGPAPAQDEPTEPPPVPLPHPVRVANEPAADFAEAASELFGLGPMDGASLTSPEYLVDAAYGRLQAGNVNAAVQIASAMTDPAGALLVEWLIAIDGYAGTSAARMAEAAETVIDWPARTLIQIRYEQAVRRGEPTPEQAIAAFADEQPVLEPTILLLARSYIAVGRSIDAADLIARVWRDESFSTEMEEVILTEFADFLSAEDHRWRMNRLFYDGESDAALRTAELLSEPMQALAAAWAAVNRNSNNATALLDAVPASVRDEAGYQYARLRQLLRRGEYSNAAALALDAPTDPIILIDPEAWTSQIRDLARALIERGSEDTAYELLANHPPVDRAETAEVEFLAGWVALRFLGDPNRAIPHFEALSESSSLPLSQSRAHYWLGRTYQSLDRTAEAQEQYALAAEYHLTFYGQLAAEELGLEQIPLAPEPTPNEEAITHFLDNDIVQSMIWLDGLGRRAEADILARFLGETLEDPTDIALLAQLAEARGDYQLALQIGKFAANRGLAVDGIAFSMAALPDYLDSDHAELALIFAVARQESAFNNEALSSAGAVGLLQLLPTTAREMANYVGIPFSEERLSDPAYNAILGGAYLGTMLDRYSGNIALALAAFNAGLTRADRWIEVYGDPRRAEIDTVDWIERIPFDETRNYVQRVIENLQVYRARLGSPELRLAEDLGLPN